MDLFKELKKRKLRKYLAFYVSACITAIGLVHLFSLRYSLPTFIFDSLIIIIFLGFLSVFIVVWYHGKEGTQKVKVREYIFHFIVLLAAISVIYFNANQDPTKLLPLNSKTIAVLPFQNFSDSKEDEYFSNGITEDILTQLSKISKLRVISRTSVMKYKNTTLSIKEIGNELRAGSILEGSIRWSGDKVRITGQLINASNDEHIWAETFDRNISDIFKIQTEIAIRIARELEAQLAPKERLLIETEPTENFDAYAFCLKGRDFASKYTNDDNDVAISFYKKALLIDSNYALAYAGLAAAYDQKVRRYFASKEWRDSAIDMSKKALSLNPNLAEAHSSLAKSYEAKADYKSAKYHYEESIRLNPNYYASIYNLGVVYFNENSLDKAYELIRNSINLEPQNVFGHIVIGGIYQKFGCDNLALKWLNKAIDLDQKNLLGWYYLIDQYILMNDLTNARKSLMELINISPDWIFAISSKAKLELLEQNYSASIKSFNKYIKQANSEKEYDYGFALLKLGKKKEAHSILKTELANYRNYLETNQNVSGEIYNDIANIHSIMGNRKEAFTWLSQAMKNGWIDYRQNLVYPYLDSLKNTKEFSELIGVMKSKIDSMKNIVSNEDKNWEECK